MELAHPKSYDSAAPSIVLVQATEEQKKSVQDCISINGYPTLTEVDDIQDALALLQVQSVDIILLAEKSAEDTDIDVLWNASASVSIPPTIIITNDFLDARESELQNLSIADYFHWEDLTPKFLNRAIRCAILADQEKSISRDSTEELISRIFELEHSYATMEEQAGENAYLAEQFYLVQDELKEAMAEVVETKEQLELLNQEKNRLFSIIAHDLRSPLTSLLTAKDVMDYLGDGLSRDDLVQHINGMYDNAKSVYSLLENLLEWPRIQMDQVAFQTVPVDVQSLASNSQVLLTPVATDKLVTIYNDVPESVSVLADRNMLDTIIRNLVNNAIKFTPKGGTIIISTHTNEDSVKIQVQDTGIGIPPDRIDQLFTLEKGSSTLGTNAEKGTGLGLIICRDMVHKNSGKISVTSVQGEGSCFTVELPRPA